ncbi:MAG: hypothetical protein ACTHJQ_03935 [Rhizobiaceae bacterium]
MGKLPKKFVERVGSNVKKYQRIVAAQQKADVAEAVRPRELTMFL